MYQYVFIRFLDQKKKKKVRKFSRGRKLNKWVIKEGKDEVKTRRERVNEGR